MKLFFEKYQYKYTGVVQLQAIKVLKELSKSLILIALKSE